MECRVKDDIVEIAALAQRLWITGGKSDMTPPAGPVAFSTPPHPKVPPFALLSCPIHDHAELLMPLLDSLVVPAASFLLPAVIDFEERGRSPCE